MLVRLTVENYKSFGPPQTFSMQAAAGRNELPGNLVATPTMDLIKTAAIYGHNASGKTNLLDVFYALGAIIIGSARGGIPERVPRIEPFRLDPENHNRPSRFEVELLLDDELVEYTLLTRVDRIVSESLRVKSTKPRSKWKALFTRFVDDREQATVFADKGFGKKAQRDLLGEGTVRERSMLGHAAELNVEPARRVFDWFDDQLFFYKLHSDFRRQAKLLDELADRMSHDPAFKRRFIQILGDADLGVVDAKTKPISAEQLELFEQTQDLIRRVIAPMAEQGFEIELPERPLTDGMRLTHRNWTTGYQTELAFARESSGTRRFMALLYCLMAHGEHDRPGTVVVDEIDSSLSPELVLKLIELAHHPEVNRSGMQLIFTTHDRSLMREVGLLRRDQVWIANKGEGGHTELYSLADFGSEVKPHRAWERGFNAGRYGGVANFGPSLEALPVPREPQKLSLFETGAR